MNGRKAAEIPAYSRKYGYNLLESITDLRKLLRYLLKSLDRAQEYRQKGQHLYYASRNVGRPQKLKAVPCTQAMQDKIEALAVDSYRHKQKMGKSYTAKHMCCLIQRIQIFYCLLFFKILKNKK